MDQDNILRLDEKISFMQKLCTAQGYDYRLKSDIESNEAYFTYLKQQMIESRRQKEECIAISTTATLLKKFINSGIRSFDDSDAMYLLLYCKLSLQKQKHFDDQTWADLCNNLFGNEYLPDHCRQKLIEYSKIENPTIDILESFN